MCDKKVKVALVTGGARGSGCAIAFDLAADHEVAVTYSTTHLGEDLDGGCPVTPIFAIAPAMQLSSAR
jgi:NAD(P)-dependent dehydrogenase (short-subunit alcohol dehydrogenase family)